MMKHCDPHDLQKKALNWAYLSRGLNRVHDVHDDTGEGLAARTAGSSAADSRAGGSERETLRMESFGASNAPPGTYLLRQDHTS